MQSSNIMYQCFSPDVAIFKSIKDFKNNSQATYYFNLAQNKNLQSFNFSLSRNDVNGSFSLTFFPESNYEKGKENLFDNINVMDIVRIREFGRIVFIGIVKSKKYVTQVNDSGATRRLSISGIAATGLVSMFLINLDTSACVLTEQYKTQKDLTTALTLKNSGENKKISEIIESIWDCFLTLSSQLGTPAIADYITGIFGKVTDLFNCDDSTFSYPLRCVFQGQQTQDFFSLIDGLIPSPIYEKIPRVVADKMQIAIRKCPFDADVWSGNKITRVGIEKRFVKSFEVSQSDNEVYTVFYAYLNGYPIDEEKGLRLSTLDEKIDTTLKNSDKFKKYGYRPLFAHFIGYGTKDGETDDNSQSSMEQMSTKLKEWYEHLPEMLSGNITMAMYDTKKQTPMPGDVVSFLDYEFYVEGISHSWNYGSGGEINISVSRGGSYKNGVFSPANNITKNINTFEDKK